MKKRTLALTIALGLILATAPVLAGEYDVIWQNFDRDTNSGQALIYLGGADYAMIWYIDADESGTYTPGDVRLKVMYVTVQQ